MESAKFGIKHLSHCHGVSGMSPLKTGAVINRHALWNQMLQSSQATEGLDSLHVTTRSQIPHGNFGFRLMVV